jgi:hypothetical protein
MSRAKKAWLAIAVIVVGHNVSADDGDTLSEVVDGWIAAHPWLARSVIAVLALHLANAISNRVDPVHLVFVGVRARRRISVHIDD